MQTKSTPRTDAGPVVEETGRVRPLTKARLIDALTRQLPGLERRDVTAVLAALVDLVVAQLKSCGEVTIPGVAKLKVTHRPAVAEREGIDPFTKQAKVFKAKPASKAVKAAPVKPLKDAVA